MSPPGPPGRRHGHGKGPVEKPKDFGKIVKKILGYSKKYIPYMIIAVIFSAVSAILAVIGPDILSDLTNEIEKGLFGTIDMDLVISISTTLIVIYVLSLAFNVIQGFMMATASQRISQTMRTDISSKINRIPLSYYDKRTFGETLSRVTNDIDSIGVALNQSIGSFANAIALLFGCLIMMIYTNWLMAAVGILATLLGFGLMSIIMMKSQKHFNNQQKYLAEINGQVEEMYTGHLIVKAYNGERNAIDAFDNTNEYLYESAWKSQFMGGMMMPLMSFIGNLGYVAVCITGAILVMNGSISIGVIVAFMIYIRLFTSPLNTLAEASRSLQSAAAAGERVFEFLEEDEMSDESEKKRKLSKVRGDVEFRNVSFGYEPGRTIIHNLSFKAKAGQKIAIVGPTGAGKTTLVNLLMRFYDVDEGTILIDDVPINEMSRQEVHDLFCMILQDTWLFEGTIRENIKYCDEYVTEDEIYKACDAVGLSHFIQTLPDGIDTKLGDNSNISIGQKQQITIARAVVDNAPMLILDEATSSVDTRTEKHIHEAMDSMTKGRTSFVIAHRLSTVRNADVILVVRNGDIIEQGNHEELMAKDGFYCELYNSQFEDE